MILEGAAAEGLMARDLGARGSRRLIGSSDPAAELTPTAAAVLAAIPAWWSARASAAGLDGQWLEVTAAIAAKPPLTLPELPPLEQEWGGLSGEEVGQAYVQALSAETRSRHGRHYTPPVLADQLWQMARSALSRGATSSGLAGLIRDPACGAGALLLPVLREHLHASGSVNAQLLLARLPSLIEGIDTDPAAVWVANVVLAAELLPVLARVAPARRRPLPALVRVGDGLAEQETPADVIVMNPPYGRVKLSPSDRERFADTLYGHANLYGVFLAAGQANLAPGGVMAALVPTSFTAGRYFQPLRARLTERLRVGAIRFVESRSGVFTSVLQETCLVVFTERRVKRCTVTSVAEAVTTIATVACPVGGDPWIVPRRSDLAPVAAAAALMPSTLKSAGWGVSTGPLVWNRRRDDLSSRAAQNRAPVLWAADVDGGVLHRDKARNQMRYLHLRSDRDRATMVLDEPAVLVQRTTSPEQTRRLVAAELNEATLEQWGGEVVVENHVNVLRPTRTTPELSAALLTRLLATKTFDQVARCISGSVALSAYELESFPLPTPNVLAEWEELSDEALAVAVRNAYHPTAPAQGLT